VHPAPADLVLRLGQGRVQRQHHRADRSTRASCRRAEASSPSTSSTSSGPCSGAAGPVPRRPEAPRAQAWSQVLFPLPAAPTSSNPGVTRVSAASIRPPLALRAGSGSGVAPACPTLRVIHRSAGGHRRRLRVTEALLGRNRPPAR
jgi:hypothetical protein